MIAAIASILPIAFYFLLLKLLDSFVVLKTTRLFASLIYGVACCLALYLISKLTGRIVLAGVSLMPLLEEILKGGLMIVMVGRKKIRFMAEALIYGAAVGGGFALLENIIYLTNNPGMLFGTAVFRGFGSAFLHIGCTALIATLPLMGFGGKVKAFSKIAAFIPSIALHFLFNAMDIPPFIKLVVTLTVFLFLFIWLFRLNNKKIYQWIDHSISIDIQTLSSVKNGNFTATKAGEYLLGVREQFPPEVFFDMINYVELFLEMKIEKQSQLLLTQAGFDIEDKKEKYQSMKVELMSLREMIGKTGLQVLAPLVQEKV